MIRSALLVGFAVFAVSPALADDIRPESSITAVTVYPLGASIVRTVPVQLPAGASVVVIGDLPQGIETDSITVAGKADQPIEIGSVDSRPASADEVDPKRQAMIDAILGLQDKLDRIGGALGALDGRREFVEKLIAETPAGFGKALGQAGDDVARWRVAAETIGSELAAIAEARRALEIDARGIRGDLAAKKKALAALKPQHRHLSLRVAVNATAATTGVLTLTYREPGARWAPSYDAMLDTGEGDNGATLTLVRRAEVTQATGEDWTDVALTLSTARPAGGTAMPELASVLVHFRPAYDAVARPKAMREMAMPAPAAEIAGGALADVPARIIEAAADFGDFHAAYLVPGRVTIESGVGARSVRIASETMPATLDVRAVPALTESAFLYAAVASKSDAPLLAGKVSLFRDGGFVGSGAIPFTNAGRTVDLGFGADDHVRVRRVALDRETGEHGILTSRHTDTRRYRISVENLHGKAMRITVLDRMPFAEDDKIVVARLDGSTEPTKVNVDDRRGVLAWTYTYSPGESREIDNAYEVSWPSGRGHRVGRLSRSRPTHDENRRCRRFSRYPSRIKRDQDTGSRGSRYAAIVPPVLAKRGRKTCRPRCCVRAIPEGNQEHGQRGRRRIAVGRRRQG